MPRPFVDVYFLATLAFLFYGVVKYIRHALVRLGMPTAPLWKWSAGIIAWQGLLGILAALGMFSDFSGQPPRIAYAIIPSLAAAIILGMHSKSKRMTEILPIHWPILFQGFRLAIELVLWQLAARHELPKEMTFEGQNFDVLIGLTAWPMAWWAGNGAPAWVIRAWNVAGLLTLTNVAAIGLLSAPTQFQMLHTDPPNSIIGTFPYIWLPCFAVASAYFFHFISLRQPSLQTPREA